MAAVNKWFLIWMPFIIWWLTNKFFRFQYRTVSSEEQIQYHLKIRFRSYSVWKWRNTSKNTYLSLCVNDLSDHTTTWRPVLVVPQQEVCWCLLLNSRRCTPNLKWRLIAIIFHSLKCITNGYTHFGAVLTQVGQHTC